MKRWKTRLPAACILAAIILNIGARMSSGFADFYAERIFPLWTATYGRLTGLFLFSVGEWMLYLAVLLVFLLLAGGILCVFFRGRISKKWKSFYKRYALFLYQVFGVVCMIMTLNCFLLYQTSPINERFEIGGGQNREYGTEELAILRDYVVERANELAPSFERDEQGYLIVPEKMDIKEEAKTRMQQLGELIPGLEGYYPNPKGLCLSGFYSQQYIMGYYFPFSMEANYNQKMYLSNMPVTMCHELSHVKGFILEDEANFISYLACAGSREPLFRYSAYLSVLNYLDRDFKKAINGDGEQYRAHPQICGLVLEDRRFLTKEAWEQVEERALLDTELVKQASDKFLDTTLTLNGVADGRISYSRVVKLLLQYYDGTLYESKKKDGGEWVISLIM